MANVEVLTNARPGVAPVKEGTNEGVPLGELESEITAAAGTATLKAEPGAAYEKGQFLIRIGEELIVCTLSKVTLTLVTRGAESTTAAIHAAKAQVYNVTTEGQLEKWLEQHRGVGANVLHYKADSTGVEDATAAFKEAGEASKTVYVPTGTYLIAGTVDVTGLTLIGDGMGRTILTKNGTSSAMLTVKPTEGSSTAIQGFTLTNSNHEATEGAYIKVEAATELIEAPVKIEDIETKYAFHAFEFGLCLFVMVARVYHYKWKGNCFWFHSGANDVTVRQFLCQDGSLTTGVAIRLEGKTPAMIFEGGNVETCAQGLYASIEGGTAAEHRPENGRYTDVFFDDTRGKFEVKNVCTTTEGSALVKMTVARSGVNVGNVVEGSGVPGGTTVSEVKLATNEIKLSANIEAGKSGTPTLTFTSGTSNAAVLLAQCFDMRFENCWVATSPLHAKVAGFQISSCELVCLTNCIAFTQFYSGYWISGSSFVNLTGCTAWKGAEGVEYQGTKVGQVSIVGGSNQVSVPGGVYQASTQYAFVVGETSKNIDINGPVASNASKGEILNEASSANAPTVYFRAAGKEPTLARAEITTWFSAKVEENTSAAARIHAGNVELRGIIKVKAAEKIVAGETFMTIPIAFGPYRPSATRRARLYFGKELEAPKEVWVEIKGNGEILPMTGAPEIPAEDLIYLDETWYPLVGA